MDNVGWNYDWQSARIQADIEARKADTELIRQMLEALEAMQSEAAARSCGLRICDEALAAGRARLEDKP